MKRCSKCKEYKIISSFHKDSSRIDGLYGSCKPCSLDKCKRYRESGRPRELELQRLYNISLNDYNNMYQEQKGICRGCNKESTRTLNVDHCHKTGNVRGLLCCNCNRALGMVKDDINILNNLINYLGEV